MQRLSCRLVLSFVALLALAAGGCGGGGDAHPPGAQIAFYVHPTLGDDAAAGTMQAPFRSLGHAFSLAVEGDVIQALPGTYREPEESFPLRIPAGVTLRGDEASRGLAGPTEIEVATAFHFDAIVPGRSSVLAGISVRVLSNNLPNGVIPPCVSIRHGSVVVRRCTLRGPTSGILVMPSAPGAVVGSIALLGNDISDFAQTGISLIDGVLSAILQDNLVLRNGRGVTIASIGAPDLGGGYGSTGGNAIAGNTYHDLEVHGDLFIYADHCRWDVVPPRRSGNDQGGGIEIFVANGSLVSSDDARLYIVPAPN